MSEHIDAVVIGAGVVGLACARALAWSGLEVVIHERNDDFGMETSARNSDVIHAGICCPIGSLKAQLRLTSREAIYAFCFTYGVEHLRCGKLIVASETQQVDSLDTIRARALANGVDDLQLLTSVQAQALEPELNCSAAMLSPSTGIIDSRTSVIVLLVDAERHGASLARHSTALSMRADAYDIFFGIESEGQSTQLPPQSLLQHLAAA
jgi:L-2-hydroxyglutarate oxidase LhgO